MRLFIPGQGMVDTGVYRVDAAVKAYDSRLMFGQHPETGDYCVFVELPRPNEPYPVIGFGSEVPDPDKVVERLQRADTMRNGDAIYREVVRSQESYRKDLEYKTDQAGEESAEVIEHFMRREGKSPVIKSLRKKGVSE